LASLIALGKESGLIICFLNAGHQNLYLNLITIAHLIDLSGKIIWRHMPTPTFPTFQTTPSLPQINYLQLLMISFPNITIFGFVPAQIINSEKDYRKIKFTSQTI
jgi:hypothetical protein